MDLHTAVSISMLPQSRGRVAAVCKQLREQDADVSIELVLEALRVHRAEHAAIRDAAERGATRALEEARDLMDPIACFDARYPALLNRIADPPPVLWVQGAPALLDRPSVAVIGSRAATPYALAVGARLAGELAGRGIVVTSGLARGVDSAAHRGCLDAAGQTVAVLGSGLDNVYPPEHEGLAAEIARTGAVISELGPGGPPLQEHFPLRNRIISGISLAVVVVEASEHSGSLITARMALEQGREVMAVPGSVLSGRNRGSHALLKDGAKVVESADDILSELGWGIPASPETGSDGNPDPLLGCMIPGESYEVDELAQLTGLGPAVLLARLTELELAGLVLASAGRYSRAGRV